MKINNNANLYSYCLLRCLVPEHQAEDFITTSEHQCQDLYFHKKDFGYRDLCLKIIEEFTVMIKLVNKFL